MENRCISCGEIIPEGRLVCNNCSNGYYSLCYNCSYYNKECKFCDAYKKDVLTITKSCRIFSARS